MALDPNPFSQFSRWADQARESGGPDPYVVTLATASPDGQPAARMVIIRGYDEGGFIFYTDLDSPKAHDLEANPRAGLVFYWPATEHQIRVSGRVERISAEQTERYWASRPRGAQVAAWIRQSHVVADRAEVEAEFARLEQLYGSQSVPRPPFWVGYRIVPASFEFWESRPNRVHDRLRYTRTETGWRREVLTP